MSLSSYLCQNVLNIMFWMYLLGKNGVWIPCMPRLYEKKIWISSINLKKMGPFRPILVSINITLISSISALHGQMLIKLNVVLSFLCAYILCKTVSLTPWKKFRISSIDFKKMGPFWPILISIDVTISSIFGICWPSKVFFNHFCMYVHCVKWSHQYIWRNWLHFINPFR